ncbi:nuclear transport factor 2 family protein [Pseudonocardia acaciae]|uniref:nuclear transport factor 2 family protein n=1 Tax=Pseudonocardia acaciae TaxID=551276 RepID=UPI0004903DBD|nr:nuclear transport factor 2 family protein [Pseudonocardia acaciae]
MNVEAEVVEQHRLLAAWLGSAAGPEVLDELRDAHTDDFSMVTTDGQALSRAALLDGLAGARNATPGLHILISEVTVVAELGDAVLARFLETHVAHGHTSSRRVTVLLQLDEKARNGLRWRYLHETPIAD